MTLTRKDVLIKSIRRPLGGLRFQDMRGRMKDFHRADVVLVAEGGKVQILKDRQGDYLRLPVGPDNVVDARELIS